MEQAVRKPDIEIIRKQKDGSFRSYGHLYWKPFIVAVFLFGRALVFRDRKLKYFSPTQKE
ncbi:hypothetical protein M0R04_14470 [Candidatus Dojkabacteria bacterium]|nr:hypothetical protein [Candidatus Dojkabacteria bacterium]